MPAPKAQDGHRRGKLVQGLFWGGVSLAPVAILILLFGAGTGSLRIAVTLAVLTIVMLAVSIAMRPSIEIMRVDIEHRVLDEMERVRLHTRDDISTAARNTHRALTDQIQVLTASMEDLRSQVDEVQTGAMLPPMSPGVDQVPGAPGTVRRTETVHVTRRTTTAMAGDGDPSSTGTVYGSRPAAVDGEWRERGDARRDEPHQSDDRYVETDRSRNDDRSREDRYRDDRHRDDRDRDREDRYRDDRAADDRDRDSRRDDDRHGDARYGDDRGRDEHDRGREDRAREDRAREDRAREDRAREDRAREDRAREDRAREDRARDDRGREDRARDDRGRDDRRYDERGYDGMSSGDRWAAVRDDDHGRELRVGERRSSVHSDGGGTEYRVEDRWAALRRDDPPDRAPSGDSEWESTFRSLSRPGGPRALPPAPGDSPGRYTDDRFGDDRYADRDRYDAEPIRSRGRERLARESERDWDRGADDRGYERDDRYAPRPRSGHPTEYDR